jgi:hypothetical protein
MECDVIRFGTQIAIYKVDKELNDELLERGKKQTKPYNELLVANIENEFGFDDNDKKVLYPKILPYLKDYVEKYVTPNDKEINFDLEIRDIWINFQRQGEYNPPHIHPGHLSFCFYVQIPEELKDEKTIAFAHPPGSISFTLQEYPKIRGVLNNLEMQIDNAVLPKWFYNHLPRTCDLIVFPSYVSHFVESFKTAGIERVSIAGNAFLMGKYKIKGLI